jgi:hypothetical protein
MLKELHLSNFKAFGPSQSVPIKPLTLIFGANSSGKSSILHSLILAHEAFNTNELDVFKTVLGGDSVDLGGFRQYVYRRNDHERITFSFELDAALLRSDVENLFKETESIILTIQIGREQKEVVEWKPVFNEDKNILEETPVPTGKYEPGPSPRVVAFELATKEGYLLKMSHRPNNIFQLDTINDSHPVIRNLLESILLSFTTTTVLTDSDWDLIRGGLEEIIPKLTASTEKIIPYELIIPKGSDPSQQSFIPIGKGTRRTDIASALSIFVPRSLNEIIKAAYRSFSSVINTLVYLGPLRSYPPRLVHAVPEKDANWQSGGGLAWNVVLRDQAVREQVNTWLSDPKRLSTPYSIEVDNLYRIDQWLAAFQKQLSGSELEKLRNEVSSFIEAFEKLRDPEIQQGEKPAEGLKGLLRLIPKRPWSTKDEKIDEILERIIPIDAALALSAGYDVEDFIDTYMETLASSLSLDVESKDFLSLIDKRTNTIVSHRDVGVGISQVLPVLVYAYANKGRILAIEQPEIHLHPQLQAELGDVFIQSSLGENKNTLLLETHSEHIILRILKRIRETTSGKNTNTPPITPSDVSLLCVIPSGHGSEVQEIRIDERGRLIDRVPGGFFEEDFAELF